MHILLPFCLRVQQLKCFDSQLNGEAGFGVIEIEARNFGNAIHAILQRVAMDEKRFRGLREIAVMGKVSGQCLDQTAVVRLVVFD